MSNGIHPYRDPAQVPYCDIQLYHADEDDVICTSRYNPANIRAGFVLGNASDSIFRITLQPEQSWLRQHGENSPLQADLGRLFLQSESEAKRMVRCYTWRRVIALTGRTIRRAVVAAGRRRSISPAASPRRQRARSQPSLG